MMKQTNLIAILLMFALVGCVEKKNEATDAKTTFDLMTVEQEDAVVNTSYSASIRGKQDIAIYPQVSGYLSQIKVKEGAQVKKDQVLFVIDQAPYQAALQSAKAGVIVAEASVASAQLNYDNSLELKERKIVSDAELLNAQIKLEGAKAQLALAKSQQTSAQVNLDFTVIKSPADGVVGSFPYRQGTLVSPGLPQSLTVVSNNSEMYVYFSMSEPHILNMIDKYGSLDSLRDQMPHVALELNNGKVYDKKGKVESISGVIDARTGSISMRAVFPNDDKKLLSGGAGNIILENSYTDVILVPKAATYEIQDRVCVFKVEDNKTVSTIIDVEKGPSDKVFIVKSGLEVGDVIIAKGAGLVRPGMPVNQ